MMREIWLLLAGAVGGLIGGMGMGGGTLLIPMLTLFLGVGQKTAQAINLVAFIPMALAAVFIHFKNKLVDVKQALWVVIPALATCVVSSIAVKGMRSETLSRGFGIFLTLLGATMLTVEIAGYIRRRKSKRRG